MSEPKVSGYQIGLHGAVVIRFTDGHAAAWIPSTGGFGASTTLEQFLLEHRDTTVAAYNSPYQQPQNTSPHGFAFVDPSYPLKRITAYWKAGDHYIRNAWFIARHDNPPNDLWVAWVAIRDAYQDLQDVLNGRWQLPQ